MSLLQVSYNNPTQPAIGLSSLCLILDVAKSMHDDEIKNAGFAKMFKYLDVDHRYFYDGALVYSNVDRVGGVVSHLNKLYSEELKNTLGDEHSSSRAMDSTHTTLFRDICKLKVI